MGGGGGVVEAGRDAPVVVLLALAVDVARGPRCAASGQLRAWPPHELRRHNVHRIRVDLKRPLGACQRKGERAVERGGCGVCRVLSTHAPRGGCTRRVSIFYTNGAPLGRG